MVNEMLWYTKICTILYRQRHNKDWCN